MTDFFVFFGFLGLVGYGIYRVRRSVRRRIDSIPDHERWMN